jgi:hypothetical protein
MIEVVFENWTIGRDGGARTVVESLGKLVVYCLLKMAARERSVRAFDMMGTSRLYSSSRSKSRIRIYDSDRGGGPRHRDSGGLLELRMEKQG